MISELTPSQISSIKKQLNEGKTPFEISRVKNKDGSITRLFSNDDVRRIRSLVRKEA